MKYKLKRKINNRTNQFQWFHIVKRKNMEKHRLFKFYKIKKGKVVQC